ncbi:AraC family transcriptional regulator [Pseudonocardia sp.]|uniref:AraC family transcriptional regulator n=1 Tax=Pseudonocardia sp. TaxID=60912 RepID=UPI0025F371DF|nr:AraC family transcriptional regulator [Pseudonocardia sp.]
MIAQDPECAEMSRLRRFGFIDARRTDDPVRRKVRSRGVPPGLQNHEIFYTEDVREASDLIGRALSPIVLTVRNPDPQPFAAMMFGVRMRDVSMFYIDLTVATTVKMRSVGPYYAVHMPTNGRVICEQNGRTFDANPIQAAVTSPGDDLTMALDDDSPQLVIRFEQDAVTSHLTRLLGGSLRRPIAFEPEMDLTTDDAMRWNGAIQLLHSEIYHEGSLIHRGQGVGPMEELLMSTLLLLQPSNYRSQLVRPTGSPTKRVIRNTLDYIETHLSERITMTDLAVNAHMSIRAIQQGFHDELGTSPMLYLRDRRLERARGDLTDAVPSDGVTVTEIAQRWGFNHLGSFAVLYRKRWGESPSETLRQ